MADTIPPTGSDILDQDLKSLLKFNEVDDLQDRLTRVSNPRLSVDDIVAIIPLSVLRMAKGLVEINDGDYSQMRNGVSADARPFLDRARKFAIDQLAQIVKHPSVQALGETVANELTGTERRISAATRLNVISAVHHAVFFMPHEGQLIPSVRLFLDAQDNRQLIDCTLELDNLAFMALGLVQALKSGMAETKTIDGPCRLTLSQESNRRLCVRLRDLVSECHAVEELARNLGLDLTAPDTDTGSQDETA